MKEQVIQLLGLRRDKIFQDAKIPKSKFFELDDFNAEKKKIFTNDVEEITLLAVLNEETINIAPFKNEEVNYSEIYIIYVSLKKDENSAKIIEVIQKNIPNPTIIVLSFEDKICIATALKRLSKAEQGKQVIEDMQMTNWLNLAVGPAQERGYLEGLNIAKFSFFNLYNFYQEFSLYIYQSVLLPLMTKFIFLKQLSIEVIGPYIAVFQDRQAEAKKLKDEESKAINFGEKLALHQQVIQAEKGAEKAKEAIKQLLEKYLN